MCVVTVANANRLTCMDCMCGLRVRSRTERGKTTEKRLTNRPKRGQRGDRIGSSLTRRVSMLSQLFAETVANAMRLTVAEGRR